MVGIVFISLTIASFSSSIETSIILSKSRRLKSNCNTADDFAPCVCRVQATGTVVHQNNRWIGIEFLESVCAIEENRRREIEGEIFKDYTCYQVQRQTQINHDVYGNPIDVVVNRRIGCELRCIAKECGMEDKDTPDKIAISEM